MRGAEREWCTGARERGERRSRDGRRRDHQRRGRQEDHGQQAVAQARRDAREVHALGLVPLPHVGLHGLHGKGVRVLEGLGLALGLGRTRSHI